MFGVVSLTMGNSPLPTADCLICHSDFSGKASLCHVLFFSSLWNKCSKLFCIHYSISSKSIFCLWYTLKCMFLSIYDSFTVTCSRHLNLTDFEVGASCSIALQGKAKTGYPRVSRGSFFIRLRIFSVLLCTFFIYSFSFFQNIDRRIHIPVHPVSTFA